MCLISLLIFCVAGLFPHWKSLDPNQAVRNCQNAMDLANRHFGVPRVLEPEYLASPWLDELSGMTYLSYFMKPDGPGYNASMRWVNSQLNRPVNNFTVNFPQQFDLFRVVRGFTIHINVLYCFHTTDRLE